MSLLLRKKIITPKWSPSSKAYVVIKTSHYNSFSLRRRQPVIIFFDHNERNITSPPNGRILSSNVLPDAPSINADRIGRNPLSSEGFFRGSINSANKIGAPCNINFQRGSAHSVNYSTKKKGPFKVRTCTQCLQCKIANQERKQNTFFFFQSGNLVEVFLGGASAVAASLRLFRCPSSPPGRGELF